VYTSPTGTATSAPSANLFGLNNLYAATDSPVLVWAKSFPGGFNRSSITTSLDGTLVYALDSTGILHCVKAADGTTCGSWTDYNSNCSSPLSGASAGASGSSPWVDYTAGNIYFGDHCGYVHKVTSSGTAATNFPIQPGQSASFRAAFEASPVVLNGYIYIGDDLGQLWRINSTTPSSNAYVTTCTLVGISAPCPDSGSHPWAVRSSIAYDTNGNNVYAVADDYVFQLSGVGTNWTGPSSSPKHLSSGVNGTTNGPMESGPVLDPTNNFVYVAFNSKLFKITYPFTGTNSSGVYSTPLANGSGDQNPLTDVLTYNNATYVGDNAGYAERFDCATQPGSPMVDGVSTQVGGSGSSVSADGVLDYATGNVNYGLTTSAGGALYQAPIALGTGYVCPKVGGVTGVVCNQTTGAAYTCVGTSGNYGDACNQCCQTSDCTANGLGGTCAAGVCTPACTGSGAGTCTAPADPNASVSCTSGNCVYSCNSGFSACNGNPQTASNACVSTTSDVNNCGGCGNICSTTNIPIPVCSAGVCVGHCADGFVDCDGNRLSNGCEASAACGTSGCCGHTCATGTVCYDNGGTGTCIGGQTTEAWGVNSQNNTVSVTCPAGQLISSITFADYGTPLGVGG
jgi:hypothetical protein